jgi:hypothetical protein
LLKSTFEMFIIYMNIPQVYNQTTRLEAKVFTQGIYEGGIGCNIIGKTTGNIGRALGHATAQILPPAHIELDGYSMAGIQNTLFGLSGIIGCHYNAPGHRIRSQ